MTLTKINPIVFRHNELIAKYIKSQEFYDLPSSIQLNKCLYSNYKAMELRKLTSKHRRLIVYARDVEILYGKGDYDSLQVLKDTRVASDLPKGAPVLINDFCEYTGIDFTVIDTFMNENRLNINEDAHQLPASWSKYQQTRDWYDIPDSIDANNLLHLTEKSSYTKIKPLTPPRHIVYPKDVEKFYNYTTEAAFNFLNDIRQSQDLSISLPVLIAHVNAHTKYQECNFMYFILNT